MTTSWLRVDVAILRRRGILEGAQRTLEQSVYWHNVGVHGLSDVRLITRWRRRSWVLCQYVGISTGQAVTVLGGVRGRLGNAIPGAVVHHHRQLSLQP